METGQAVDNFFSKKQVKSDVNRAALAVMLNLAIMYVVVFAGLFVRMFVVTFKEMAKNPNYEQAMASANTIIESDAFWDSAMESGIESLVAIMLGTFFVWIIMRRKTSVKTMLESNNKMTAKAFGQCLCVFMGIQIPIVLLDGVIETILNQFGLTAAAGLEMATGGSTTISMFLYAAFGAPIVEEVIYRGFVMRSLEKYGKVFAIVISAIMFGLMHTNLTQSIFAMLVGLVLGYVAMNYSLKWAILLHFINNCIFSEMMTFLLKDMDEKVQNIIETGSMGAFCIAGIVILILKRKNIVQYVKTYVGNKEYYKYAFTSVWFLIFIVACSLGGLMVIQRL